MGSCALRRGIVGGATTVWNKKKQFELVCVILFVCACISLLRCVHFCYTSRSRCLLGAAALLQNIGEEKSYNVFLKLFSTIFHRNAWAGVSVCPHSSKWDSSQLSFAFLAIVGSLIGWRPVSSYRQSQLFLGESEDRIFFLPYWMG